MTRNEETTMEAIISCNQTCGNWPAKTADECTFCPDKFNVNVSGMKRFTIITTGKNLLRNLDMLEVVWLRKWLTKS